ncbi:uncharacterized protein PV09_07774 [Verruconis gallopava]|uniref:Major facilitator superfamily (MFS) profile domain-containing protein n=1 Tax=Verruconis gallopava TaxID=253628 RepID=A0A0D2A331_9PEZI|nr:uncharacterized protein PV09_07774 [Verruconis gallopava]KIW00795.1 hypothetical protein PV09_07774 [Verruconis gallopava]
MVSYTGGETKFSISCGEKQLRSSSGQQDNLSVGALETAVLVHKRKGKNVQGRILGEEEIENGLARSFSCKKKWLIVTILCVQQISMNLNASILGNCFVELRQTYGVTETILSLCQSLFLVAYAFGCELWAPWSEESGRRPTLQWSLGFVNLWQLPQIFMAAFGKPDQGDSIGAGILFCRIMGGLCSAGGSVTLGIIADMFDADSQQYAMAALVCASVMGSIVGPVIGGFLESFVGGRWVFLAQFVIGLAAQLLHAIWVPETRSSVLVAKEARRRRDASIEQVWTQAELDKTSHLSIDFWKDAAGIWTRPFKMLAMEPIVTCLSLISGFSDALIFSFLESLPMIMDQWDFVPWQRGLCFISIGIGYLIGWAIWVWDIGRRQGKRQRFGSTATPETRLRWLLYTAPLLPTGMIGFAWTATGPPRHWLVPNFWLALVGIANYAIYGATVDYMVASYGPRLSASATGGNGFCRDLWAGVSVFYVKDLYSKIGPPGKHLPYGSTVLAGLAMVLIVPVYLFCFFGATVRKRSRYAKAIAQGMADPTMTSPDTV